MNKLEQACVKEECFTLTIKDYAKESGVTYEAVRQQIKRYSEELEGHIHLQGRTQYLDDAAVAFLNQHHLDRPLVISEAGYDRALRELEEEKNKLLEELNRYKDKLIGVHEQLRLSEAAQAKLEAAETAQATMEKLADEYKAIADQRAADAERLRAELDAALRRAAELDRDNRELKERGLLARILNR